jgi:protein-S-isoprenylcysteine O-methyltransferase Ste14
MRNGVTLDAAEAPPAPAQKPPRGVRLFARPSTKGMLICAASLMPAYLFMLLAWVRVVAILDLWWAPMPIEPEAIRSYWLSISQHLLTGTFQGVIAWLFLIRRSSVDSARARNWPADIAAVLGSVIVVGLGLAPQTLDNVIVLAASEALLTLGLVVMVAGLASLGRSFGVMPRARGLVRTGLYRRIRHPIYLGEFLAFGGMILPALSPITVTVYVTFVVLQAYRMSQEEKTLEAAYPEYAEFRASTARLLPGVY